MIFRARFISSLPRASHSDDPLPSAGRWSEDCTFGVVARFADDLHKHGDDGKGTDGIELGRVCVGVYAIVRSGCAGFTLFGKNNVRVPSRFAEMSRRCLEDVSYPSTWAETRKFMTGCDPERYLLTGNFVHAGTTCSSHVRISAFAFPP